MKGLWKYDDVQFSRLISEIHAIGLSKKQYKQLSEAMDLEIEFIDELFDRAMIAWENHLYLNQDLLK